MSRWALEYICTAVTYFLLTAPRRHILSLQRNQVFVTPCYYTHKVRVNVLFVLNF